MNVIGWYGLMAGIIPKDWSTVLKADNTRDRQPTIPTIKRYKQYIKYIYIFLKKKVKKGLLRRPICTTHKTAKGKSYIWEDEHCQYDRGVSDTGILRTVVNT